MFNVGGGELLVILLVALIFLGPTKLPGAARQIGQTISGLRQLAQGFQKELEAAAETVTAPLEDAALKEAGPEAEARAEQIRISNENVRARNQAAAEAAAEDNDDVGAEPDKPTPSPAEATAARLRDPSSTPDAAVKPVSGGGPLLAEPLESIATSDAEHPSGEPEPPTEAVEAATQPAESEVPTGAPATPEPVEADPLTAPRSLVEYNDARRDQEAPGSDTATNGAHSEQPPS